jgi:hypothetical protein
MKRFPQLRKKFTDAHISGSVVVLIVGVFGTLLLLNSHALTPTASFETENGTFSGDVSTIADANASGGRGVKFGGGASGGGCPSSIPNSPDGPDPWGGCFPGPLTTGVPAGTTLTTYGGPCEITVANTVIDSKTVNCGLSIAAANVTIKNSKIKGGITLDTDNAGSGGWSFTMQDSEADIGVQQLASVSTGNMTIIRSNIHGGQTAVQCEEKSINCVVQDSYLHGQQLPVNANWHLGGMLSDGGGPITVTHNYMICDQPATYGSDGGCTGDFNIIPNFATAHNVTATYNLFGANPSSSFCTYGGDKPTSAYPHGNHIIYQHNIFQKGTTGICAGYGPVADFNFSGVGNIWNDNKYTDGTTIICTAADECM